MLLKIFSKRLADSMELNGKKQIDVVRDLGISRSAMSQYLSGKFEPKKDRIYQLSEYFGVTPEWLMGYTNDPQGHVMLYDNMFGSQDKPAEYDPQIEYFCLLNRREWAKKLLPYAGSVSCPLRRLPSAAA